jgi:hypothetical protein
MDGKLDKAWMTRPDGGVTDGLLATLVEIMTRTNERRVRHRPDEL